MPEKPETRERIVAAAAELFHARSYDGVGVNDICLHAGVVKGSFYHFFASKDELALAVIDAHWKRIRRTLEQIFAAPGAPLERIESMFRHFVSIAHETKQTNGQILGCPFGNLAVELSTRHETIRQRIATVYEDQARMLQAVLDEAAAAGQIDPATDTALVARGLVTYVQGMAVIGKTFDDLKLLNGQVELAMKLIEVPQRA